ncbi:hypothetical protein [Glutamicibacter sp. X7]
MEQLLELLALTQSSFSDALAALSEELPQLTDTIIEQLRALFR